MNKTLIFDVILNLMGIAIFFINRYAGRTRKTKFRWSFWWSDNWQEFSTTMLLNAALMYIIHLPTSAINLDAFFSELPFGLSLAALPTMSFLLGLGFTAIFYRFFTNKIKTLGK